MTVYCAKEYPHVCSCMGSRDGEPACPCAMDGFAEVLAGEGVENFRHSSLSRGIDSPDVDRAVATMEWIAGHQPERVQAARLERRLKFPFTKT